MVRGNGYTGVCRVTKKASNGTFLHICHTACNKQGEPETMPEKLFLANAVTAPGPGPRSPRLYWQQAAAVGYDGLLLVLCTTGTLVLLLVRIPEVLCTP